MNLSRLFPSKRHHFLRRVRHTNTGMSLCSVASARAIGRVEETRWRPLKLFGGSSSSISSACVLWKNHYGVRTVIFSTAYFARCDDAERLREIITELDDCRLFVVIKQALMNLAKHYHFFCLLRLPPFVLGVIMTTDWLNITNVKVSELGVREGGGGIYICFKVIIMRNLFGGGVWVEWHVIFCSNFKKNKNRQTNKTQKQWHSASMIGLTIMPSTIIRRPNLSFCMIFFRLFINPIRFNT